MKICKHWFVVTRKLSRLTHEHIFASAVWSHFRGVQVQCFGASSWRTAERLRWHALPQITLRSSGVNKIRPLRGRKRWSGFTTAMRLSGPANLNACIMPWRCVRGKCRHAVRKRCEWPASYSGVRKRVSVQFTFAAAVRRWTERGAFMSAKKPLFFASFFCGSKRKRNKKNVLIRFIGTHSEYDKIKDIKNI